MRAEADIMVWMWSKSPEALQDAIRQIRRSGLLSGTTVKFSAMGADRMAEFNPEHVPAFTEGRKPRKWLCFYPFVRSYDWYTLDPKERARMLRSEEHTSELQSRGQLVCRLLLEKKNTRKEFQR